MFRINQKLPFLALTLMLLFAASGNPCTAQESGFLGIGFEPLGSARADNAGLERDDFPFVLEVADNSPAAAAGLRRGDILLSLNGQTLTAPQMPRRVSQLPPGATADLEVWRDGFVAIRTVTIGERPGSAPPPAIERTVPEEPAREAPRARQPEERREDPPAPPAPVPAPSTYMDSFILFGVYTWEDAEGDHELEGLFLRGFASDLDPHGFLFNYHLDLPLFAMADDDRGSLFDSAISLGYGTRIGDDLILYGSGGLSLVMFSPPDGAAVDNEEELSLIYELGALWSVTENFGVEGALRFEPNDLIDDRTWRIGAHFHSFYAAFHGRMDAERTRVDIGFRGSM